MKAERRAALFPLFVLAATLLLWCVGLEERGIWQDEGLTLYQARLPLTEVVANRIPVAGNLTQNTVPPLYFVLLALWGKVAGVGIWSLRLFGVLAGLVALALHYRAGAWMGDARTGRLALLLGALSPLYLWYAQELRMYAFLLLPATLSLALLWRLWLAAERGERLRLWAMAYALVAAALVWTHYLALLLIAAQGLWLAMMNARARPRVVLAMSAALMVMALPLLPTALRHIGDGAWRDYFYLSPLEMGRDVLLSFGFGLPVFQSPPEHARWQIPLIVALLVLGLWEARRRGGWPLAGLLASCLLIPTVALYGASFVKPLYQNARHLLFVAPIFYLLEALALQRLAAWRRWLPLLVLPLLAYGWITAFDRHFSPPVAPKNDVRPLFENIAAQAAPGDVVALNDPVLQHALEYFVPDVPWTVWPPYNLPLDDPRVVAAYEATAREYARVWYVYGPPDTGAETWEHPRYWLGGRYDQLSYLQFPGQTLVGALYYDLQGRTIQNEPYPVAVPIEAEFVEGIRMLGLYTPLQPTGAGRRTVVETLWTADAQPETDFLVVVQMVDAVGRLWHQQQFLPFNGIHRTSHWLPGQRIRLPLFVTVPVGLPPGDYTLRLSLLHPDGRSVNPVSAEGSPFTLGTLQVERAPAPPDVTGADIGALRMVAVPLPASLPPAGTLSLALRIAVVGEGAIPDGWRLRALTEAGEVAWEGALPLAAGLPVGAEGAPLFPPERWEVGDTFELRYELPLPPALAGEMRFELQPLQGEEPLPITTLWGLRRATALDLGTLTVEARAVLREPPPVAVPVAAEWPDAVELVGYSVRPDAPSSAEPLAVQLVWRAEAPTDRPYKVFLHLVNEAGDVVTADAFFEVPSVAWQAGEYLLSEHLVAAGALPPGRYTLRVGLYEEASGARFVIDAPESAVTLGEVELR